MAKKSNQKGNKGNMNSMYKGKETMKEERMEMKKPVGKGKKQK